MVHKMLHALTEIQRLAYQCDNLRSSKDLLRFYTSALTFVSIASNLFAAPKNMTTRGFFGTPYHNIVLHMPDMYRYISLRSIVAETAERMFHELR